MLTTSPLPILISGAGIAGLALARSLKSSNIPFILYERDASIHARAQGYRLRISTDGINALKYVLSAEEFERFRSGCGSTGDGGIHNFNAITGVKEDGSNGPPVNKPSANTGDGGGGQKPAGQIGLGGDTLGVAREWLKRSLVEGFDNNVQWNTKIIGYEETSTGVKVNFEDGSQSQEGCLLVAADGVKSRITTQLTDGKLKWFDTGARMIHGQTKSAGFKKLGAGVFFLNDLSREAKLGLITNVRAEDIDKEEVEFGWVLAGGPGSFEPPDNDFTIVGEKAAQMSRELTKDWDEKFKPILGLQNDKEAAFLKMTTTDPDGVLIWENSKRVTMIGDAVHSTTPAGGSGANMALWDAAHLGRMLADAGGWREGLTRQYEEEMREHTGPFVKSGFELAAKRFNIKELK